DRDRARQGRVERRHRPRVERRRRAAEDTQRQHASDAHAADRPRRVVAHDVERRRGARRHVLRHVCRDRSTARADALGGLLVRRRLPRVDEQLQRLLQSFGAGAVLGSARDRDGNRDPRGRPPAWLQRDLPLRAGRLTAGMGARLGAAARGLVTGIVAGLVWSAIETALAWWSGSVVPRPVALAIAAANLAVASVVGGLAGALAPQAERR